MFTTLHTIDQCNPLTLVKALILKQDDFAWFKEDTFNDAFRAQIKEDSFYRSARL